jgi:hypothetical protein
MITDRNVGYDGLKSLGEDNFVFWCEFPNDLASFFPRYRKIARQLALSLTRPHLAINPVCLADFKSVRLNIVTVAEVLDSVFERLYADTLELDQFGKKHESLAHQLYPLLVFSMFELVARTLLNFVNESCTDWHSEANMPPEWIEASRLTEFRIQDTGEIKVDEPRVRTIGLLIFALKYAARALHGESFAPKSLPSWPKVLEAIKIRDEILRQTSFCSK